MRIARRRCASARHRLVCYLARYEPNGPNYTNPKHVGITHGTAYVVDKSADLSVHRCQG